MKFNSAVAINLFRLITNIIFIGDPLYHHNNAQFTTKDRDNDDRSSSNCAEGWHGAFWYASFGCAHANLNGEYLRNGAISNRGVFWYNWKGWYSLMRVEMKIKPN